MGDRLFKGSELLKLDPKGARVVKNLFQSNGLANCPRGFNNSDPLKDSN
jgi:hypothetical protein